MSWTSYHDVSDHAAADSADSNRLKLQALIAEATTDSVDESDEHTGLLGMIREEVACPFRARVRGEDVECLRFQWPKKGYGLNAVCRTRTGKNRIVDIGDLEWVDPRPAGYQWIEAYFAWRSLLV
jgi:hypothetical protein